MIQFELYFFGNEFETTARSYRNFLRIHIRKAEKIKELKQLIQMKFCKNSFRFEPKKLFSL